MVVGTMTASTPWSVDLVDIAATAERLGVKRQTVNMWRYRDLLPAPEWMLNGGPVWKWATVERWAAESGRLKGPRV